MNIFLLFEWLLFLNVFAKLSNVIVWSSTSVLSKCPETRVTQKHRRIGESPEKIPQVRIPPELHHLNGYNKRLYAVGPKMLKVREIQVT